MASPSKLGSPSPTWTIHPGGYLTGAAPIFIRNGPVPCTWITVATLAPPKCATRAGAKMKSPGLLLCPQHGITSRTRTYRVLYAVLGPLIPVLKALFPKYVTTTDQVGLVMLKVAKQGAPKALLENEDINALARVGS